MFKLLTTRLRVDADLDEDVLADLLSDDVMASATRVGNEPTPDAWASRVAVCRGLVQREDDAFLVKLWEEMLAGKREMVSRLQAVRRRLPLHMLGIFKLYFVSRCLRIVFPNLVVAYLVGSNLFEATREDAGALHQMFAENINTSLPKRTCIYSGTRYWQPSWKN